MKERLLTVREVAESLRVSPGWVYDHANGKRPVLPAVRLGSSLRFREAAIEAFIAALEAEAAARGRAA
jgi:excisionase family DNA binding protein